MWIKNTWYVAAKSDEVQDQALGRTVCGEVMVFFRGPDGSVAALQDYCPHRGAPLSLGRVVDGVLVCGYHGLKMGCDGKTIALPGQTIPGRPVIKRYPAVERYGFVWVWPGDAALADPASIPVFEFFENPNWAYGGGYYAIACDYRLMVDNLMDLTHESFVHTTSISQKEIDETPCTTTVDGHHHALFLGYGTAVPAAKHRTHHQNPRGAGQDFCRRPGHARGPATQFTGLPSPQVAQPKH